MKKTLYILILFVTLASCSNQKVEKQISIEGIQNTESVQGSVELRGIIDPVSTESISTIDSNIDFTK